MNKDSCKWSGKCKLDHYDFKEAMMFQQSFTRLFQFGNSYTKNNYKRKGKKMFVKLNFFIIL